jgi:hypothetical protein
VTAALAGFKKYVNSSVTLQVNQTARLDMSLEVGKISQELTVTAEAPLLETETSSPGRGGGRPEDGGVAAQWTRL